MINYSVYKALKVRLAGIAPIFYFIGQYAKGKDNTSYVVPAIYIQMPEANTLVFYGKKQLAAKNALIRIHYIHNAPFKNHDSVIQDSALAAHEAKVNAIYDKLTGWNATNEDESLLTQQLIPVGSAEMKFMGSHVVSVLTFRTEMYKPMPQPEVV